MSEYDENMQNDYDRYMNTGELSEYFENEADNETETDE